MNVERKASSAIDTVIFDYGEVISQPQPPEAKRRMEMLSGIAPADFWAAYWTERRAYDTGIPASEYWRRIAERTDATWDGARRHELWATDLASWLHVREASVRVLERLSAADTRLVLLSNAPVDIAGALRTAPLFASFSELFFSCEIGICKPDAAVYSHVLEHLGAKAERTAFVDDRPENIAAAGDLGLDGHLYRTTAELVAFLDDRSA